MPLLYQRRDDVIDTFQLFRCDCEALAAFTANSLVLLLGIPGVIEMPLKLTAGAFLTAVTDIGRFPSFETDQLFKVRAALVAGHGTASAAFAIGKLAFGADIPVMRAGAAMGAGIKGTVFDHLVMPADFLGDSRRILADQFSDLFEREAFPQGYFNSNSFIKGKMCIFSHSVSSFQQAYAPSGLCAESFIIPKGLCPLNPEVYRFWVSTEA